MSHKQLIHSDPKFYRNRLQVGAPFWLRLRRAVSFASLRLKRRFRNLRGGRGGGWIAVQRGELLMPAIASILREIPTGRSERSALATFAPPLRAKRRGSSKRPGARASSPASAPRSQVGAANSQGRRPFAGSKRAGWPRSFGCSRVALSNVRPEAGATPACRREKRGGGELRWTRLPKIALQIIFPIAKRNAKWFFLALSKSDDPWEPALWAQRFKTKQLKTQSYA